MTDIRGAKNPALTELQTGLFTCLTAAGVSIFDEPGENRVFPYSTLGETNGLESGDKTNHADDQYETINVWSRAKGFKEGKTIAKAIVAAVSVYNFNQSGYKIRFLGMESINTLHDPDGITRRVIIRLKFRANQD